MEDLTVRCQGDKHVWVWAGSGDSKCPTGWHCLCGQMLHSEPKPVKRIRGISYKIDGSSVYPLVFHYRDDIASSEWAWW